MWFKLIVEWIFSKLNKLTAKTKTLIDDIIVVALKKGVLAIIDGESWMVALLDVIFEVINWCVKNIKNPLAVEFLKKLKERVIKIELPNEKK